MKTEAAPKKSAGAILLSNVSLRSQNSWVNYLSLILLLLIFIEITAFLSYALSNSQNSVDDYSQTSMSVSRKAKESAASNVEEQKASGAKFGAYTAFSEMRDDKSYLILKKGETETVVDEGADYNADQKAAGFGESFTDIKFSSQGNYLLYSMSDYEGGGSVIYDIKNAKIVTGVSRVEVGAGFDITPDEKYLYVCRGAGIDAGVSGKVYALPEFKEVFDADSGHGSDVDDGNNYMSNACVFDQDKNAIVFTASEPSGDNLPPSVEKEFSLGK